MLYDLYTFVNSVWTVTETYNSLDDAQHDWGRSHVKLVADGTWSVHDEIDSSIVGILIVAQNADMPQQSRALRFGHVI